MPTLLEVENLDRLLPEEMAAIEALFMSWVKARKERRWVEADRLRDKFAWWDSTLGVDGIWYPIFEENLNRQKRAFMRMKKYSVDVYPWTKELAV